MLCILIILRDWQKANYASSLLSAATIHIYCLLLERQVLYRTGDYRRKTSTQALTRQNMKILPFSPFTQTNVARYYWSASKSWGCSFSSSACVFLPAQSTTSASSASHLCDGIESLREMPDVCAPICSKRLLIVLYPTYRNEWWRALASLVSRNFLIHFRNLWSYVLLISRPWSIAHNDKNVECSALCDCIQALLKIWLGLSKHQI